MKNGIKTTEFWVSIAAGIISVIMAQLTPEQSGAILGHVDKVVVVIGPILAAFGYSISRGLAKMNSHSAEYQREVDKKNGN